MTQNFSPQELKKISGLIAKADQEGWAWLIRTKSDRQALLDGHYVDLEAAERVRTFCRQFIVQVNGVFKGKPLELFPWQWGNVILPLYGWMRPDGSRRFRRAYISVAKKCGKSCLASALQLYMLMADGESGSNCYCAAMDRKQAGLVWGEAAKYVKASPALRSRINVIPSTKRLTYERTYSVLTALSADKDTAEGIDAHCIIYDELHMAKTDAMFDILRFAGSARRQSLFIIITTAGYDLNSICGKEYKYAKKIRDSELVDTSYLSCIFEAAEDDDPSLLETWKKANPSMGLTISEEDMADAYKQAVETEKMINFRRRKLNQWVDAEDTWISSAKWKLCQGEFPAGLDRLPLFMGLDLADTNDINALLLVWKGESQIYIKPYFWVPEDTVRERGFEGRVPYVEWVRQGWLSVTPGAVTDYSMIQNKIVELALANCFVELAYDPWQALKFVNELEVMGISTVKVPQVISHLAGPTKELERLVLSGELVHDGNPVMDWMVGNTVVYTDSNDNKKPNKRRSAEKIDGVMALVTALCRVRPADGGSPYQERGLVIL